ncbi:aminotransferase-like domain-containing protein [Mangrovibacterium diazotrophicum]|uniref:2-aminoadipate transaminase n=1 Tax=Mangrovibacterium diazotrophicum TaxID=1261403 RepID=A0A419W529_9BACT|nr:PLP-dependent aminotransferase family protein [Mangrovibacterium diazotrophicum]RKD90568.1 2-aminoadipate transaminase [Mangrovibacterium diazotrophicum]
MENQFPEEKFSEQYRNIPVSFVRSILNAIGQQKMISFAGGLPNPSLFPVDELAESTRAVMADAGRNILQYAGSLGYYPLREWIASRYSAKYGMKITPEMVVITNGSQQAIDILSKLFINPGDGVILEKPSYLGAIQSMSAYLPNFKEVDLLEDGADLAQVEDLFLNDEIKLMYAVTNAQNPSGISYSDEKRQDLALLLRRYNQFLLEDDPYNEICFGEEFPAPVKKYAPDHVAWTGSFSKMVAPGLRNGWVILPPALVPHFDKAKQAADLHSNNLTQYVLHHYLTHNDLDEHLSRTRTKYEEQAACMVDMLNRYLPDDVKVTQPTGGMFIWLTLPDGLRADELIKSTMERGVIFVPGNSFYTKGQGSNHIRLNFTNADPDEIEKGVQIIAEEMKKVLCAV